VATMITRISQFNESIDLQFSSSAVMRFFCVFSLVIWLGMFDFSVC